MIFALDLANLFTDSDAVFDVPPDGIILWLRLEGEELDLSH